VVQLPRDAVLVELRADRLTFQTREAVLPGTTLAFGLVMEGRPLPVALKVAACLVVSKDRKGYLFHVQLPLNDLSEGDRQLITLFISKGRGSPALA